MSQANIPIYVINLEQSTQRWKNIEAQAKEKNLQFIRIPAISGQQIDRENCPSLAEKKFHRCHGKRIFDGEIGCYLSHIKTLKKIVSDNIPFAVIVEDDILFHDNFLQTIHELAQINNWDIIKLVNHRLVGFRPYFALSNHNMLGRCLHGPYGSAAAYMVTYRGAKKLLEYWETMYLPFDIALEMGWKGYRFFTLKNPIVTLLRQDSFILPPHRRYSDMNFPLWQRIPAFLFRGKTYIQRLIFASVFLARKKKLYKIIK